VVRDRRRRGEVAPEEFYCYLEEGVPGRAASAIFGVPQRGEFPGEQTAWFCSAGIRNTQSTSGNRFFLLRRYSNHAEHHVGVLLCGNSPPRGNPGLKCTWTDEILKKFEFKMNCK
jgi:hypothetical protein